MKLLTDKKTHALARVCFAALIGILMTTDANAAQLVKETDDSALTEDRADGSKITQTLDELLRSMNIETFSYKIEGRPDPFKPFISATTTVPADINTTEPGELRGMRKFEPGQLQLVAIIFSDENPRAMVQDSVGKGYIIKRGTKLGKSGIVSDIVQNRVIIKQLTYSMSKERRYKTVEMILRKEGEK